MKIEQACLLALEETIRQNSPTAASAYLTYARAIARRWGEKDIRDLTRREIQGWCDERRLIAKPTSIRSELAFLNRCYRVALEHGVDVMPQTGHLRLPRINNRRERILEEHEEPILAEELGRRNFSLVLFAIHTGMRRLEQFSLRIEDCRIWEEGRREVPGGVQIVRAGMAQIRTSKTGIGRQCPLNEVAANLATRWIQEGGPWLFEPSWGDERFKAVRKWQHAVWLPTVRKLGLRGLTWHSLRHTCASRALRNGATLEDICRLLGHSSITQTERYAHWLEDRLWPAARALMRAS